MKRTVRFIAVCALLLALCFSAEAQSATKIPRVGIATGSTESNSARDFQRGLRDLGYVEGKNIVTEYRFYEEKLDRIPALVNELVQLRVDVLILGNFRAIRAAKAATKTIPIVMVTTQNPVEAKLVESLARPGGNITGLTKLTRDLSGKRLELLKEVIPTMRRAGVIWESRGDPGTSGSAIAFKEYEAAAGALKIQLQSLEVRGPNPDFDRAFQSASQARADGLITIHNGFMLNYRTQVADLAIKHRLPSLDEGSAYVEAGGLMSYATSDADLYRRAAVYVDKILKGAKPADLPVEQPTKFELVINLKTAKQIGLTIPPNVLARADRVIR